MSKALSNLHETPVLPGVPRTIKAEGGKIVLTPAPREYKLDQLIAGIMKGNLHTPEDFGGAVGREAW